MNCSEHTVPYISLFSSTPTLSKHTSPYMSFSSLPKTPYISLSSQNVFISTAWWTWPPSTDVGWFLLRFLINSTNILDTSRKIIVQTPAEIKTTSWELSNCITDIPVWFDIVLVLPLNVFVSCGWLELPVSVIRGVLETVKLLASVRSSVLDTVKLLVVFRPTPVVARRRVLCFDKGHKSWPAEKIFCWIFVNFILTHWIHYKCWGVCWLWHSQVLCW